MSGSEKRSPVLTTRVIQCAAYPSCEEGEVEVEACAEGDESCHPVEECGHTIYCAPEMPVSCDAIPVCPEGMSEVESCEGGSEACMEVSECDTTILCDLIEG